MSKQLTEYAWTATGMTEASAPTTFVKAHEHRALVNRLASELARLEQHNATLVDLANLFGAGVPPRAGQVEKAIRRLAGQRNAKHHALREAEAVMARHIYPKPDVPYGHPWRVLERVRAALKTDDAEDPWRKLAKAIHRDLLNRAQLNASPSDVPVVALSASLWAALCDMLEDKPSALRMEDL